MTKPESGDALQAAPASRPSLEKTWRCFHCDEVFTDESEAREHFGADEAKTPACRLSRDDVRQLRALEQLNAKWQRECANLENDARLWHEAEADRVRRIGHVQWWQELDSREGEKLALQERVATLEAELAALRSTPGEGREPQGWQLIEQHSGDTKPVLIGWPHALAPEGFAQAIGQWVRNAWRIHDNHPVRPTHFMRVAPPCSYQLPAPPLATPPAEGARDEERCEKCHQPKEHPFHAPAGIFGSELKTHDYVVPVTEVVPAGAVAPPQDDLVARIAGNLLSGAMTIADFNTIGWRREHLDEKAVAGAVAVARGIVAEVERTEPQSEPAGAP
jgi:hypothetical protein